MLKKQLFSFIITFVFMSKVFAAGGAGGVVENIDFTFDGITGAYNKQQLQRGLKVYTEVCASCHGLKYVPFRSLSESGGPELPEDQMRAYAESFDIFDLEIGDTRPGKPTDFFPEQSVNNSPDLSLMANARAGFHGPYGTGINQFFKGMGGPEYIVALLNGYTGKEKEQSGTIFYENTIFPGGWIAMAPPLLNGQVDFDDGHKNDVHSMSEDVAAFLMWTAEPHLNERKSTGFLAVLFLGVLSFLLYLSNKRLWAPHKGKKSTEIL